MDYLTQCYPPNFTKGNDFPPKCLHYIGAALFRTFSYDRNITKISPKVGSNGKNLAIQCYR